MKVLHFDGQRITPAAGESVLDALLRSGHVISHGCKAGVCQACLMQAVSGPVPAAAQLGLNDHQKKLGYFLSCGCKLEPAAELFVQRIAPQQVRLTAQVLDVTPLDAQVFRIRLACPLAYFAGQYVTLWRDEQTARSYSVASVKALDNYIELHIKRLPEGRFSRWACEQLAVGDQLQLQGPMGRCFYPGFNQQPLLLAGLSTGLAPLYGIVRDALHQGHSAPIYLYAGAKTAAQCYLMAELLALARQYAQLQVLFMAQVDAVEGVCCGDIYQTLRERHPNLKGFKVFLCGADSFVRKMKKQCFLAGASMADIAADSFLPTAL